MAPGDLPGRLGHRGAPLEEQGDGWRADQRAGALPALSMLTSICIGAVTLPRKTNGALDSRQPRAPSPRLRWWPCGLVLLCAAHQIGEITAQSESTIRAGRCPLYCRDTGYLQQPPGRSWLTCDAQPAGLAEPCRCHVVPRSR